MSLLQIEREAALAESRHETALGKALQVSDSENAAEGVPLVSLDTVPADDRYASLEIHTLPLEARKVEFLRVDGFWFVKASEGVGEIIEDAWRGGTPEPAQEGGGE